MSRAWALFASRRGAALLLGLATVGGGGAYVRTEFARADRDGAELEASLLDWSRRAGNLEGSLIVARSREDWLDKETDRLHGELKGTEAKLLVHARDARAALGQSAQARAEAQELARSLETARRERRALEAERTKQLGALREVQEALAKAQARRAVLERELAAADAILDEQRTRLESQAKELAARQVRIKALEATLAKEERRLADTRAQLRRAERDRRASQAERERLQAALEQEQRAHQATRAQLSAAEATTRSAIAAHRAVSKRVAEAEATLGKLKAAGVNVDRLSGARPLPPLQAVVLRVDSEAVPPQVVIDAGSDLGLMRGDVLHVVRNGRSVGRVEVDELQSGLSTARLIEGSRGLVLRPGDTVRSKVPKP